MVDIGVTAHFEFFYVAMQIRLLTKWVAKLISEVLHETPLPFNSTIQRPAGGAIVNTLEAIG